MESHINRWVEPYCVLCRVTLPQNLYDPMIHNRGWEYKKEWDADVVLFFHVPHDETGVWHRGAIHMNLRDSNTTMPWTEGLMIHGFSECTTNRDCDQCTGQRRHSCHFVHSHCFQLASKFFPSTFSFARLLTAARHGRTLKAGVHMRPDHAHAASAHDAYFQHAGDKETDLGRLLSAVSQKLPPELQSMIYGDADGDLWLKSIHGCVWNLNLYFRQFFETQAVDYTENILFPLLGSPELKFIGINQISILGQLTICAVGTAGEQSAEQQTPEQQAAELQTARQQWDSTILLPADLAVTGLQLSFGLYGLVAMKVLYGNGTESDWLGGSARTFYRTLQTRDLKRMRVKYDGFKIVDLELPIEDEPCPHPESVMINLNTRLHPGRIYPVVDNINIEPEPASHFAYYIPLPSADQRIECLTMWVSGGSITNIQVNGDSATRVSPIPTPWHARAVTHYFKPEETIESFHLLWHPGNDSHSKFGPCVILITSLGRTLYFGQYLNGVDTDSHLRTLGNFKTHRPVGIIMEPRKVVACLGAAIQPRPEPLTEIDDRVLLPLRGRLEGPQEDILDRPEIGKTAFFSKASLANTVRLKYQKHVNRVTGLYIEHRDGAIEILGQYDPGKPETITSLYDADEDGPLEAITFGLSNVRRPPERVMLSIQTGRRDRPENKFVWDDFSKEATWMFAQNGDLIEYWTGELTEFDRMPPPHSQILQLE